MNSAARASQLPFSGLRYLFPHWEEFGLLRFPTKPFPGSLPCQWELSHPQYLPFSGKNFASWLIHTENIKVQAPLLQFRPTLKGHPSSRSPHETGWGFWYTCVAVQLLTLLNPALLISFEVLFPRAPSMKPPPHKSLPQSRFPLESDPGLRWFQVCTEPKFRKTWTLQIQEAEKS